MADELANLKNMIRKINKVIAWFQTEHALYFSVVGRQGRRDDIFNICPQTVKDAISEGLAAIKGDKVVLTKQGVELVNIIYC